MARRLLFVEGSDDWHVIYAIAGRTLAATGLRSARPEGVEDLLQSIPVELKAGERERLAVVLDADKDIEKLASNGRFKREGHRDFPETPSAEGTTVHLSTGVRFGVWLMPDNRLPGTLEDFVGFWSARRTRSSRGWNGFPQSIPEQQRLFPEARRPKARIHTWLGIQEEPGKPLGQAITRSYLDPLCSHVEPFLAWLREARWIDECAVSVLENPRSPMTDFRIERDSMGEVRLPAKAYYGGPDAAGRGELPDLRADGCRRS